MPKPEGGAARVRGVEFGGVARRTRRHTMHDGANVRVFYQKCTGMHVVRVKFQRGAATVSRVF